MQETPEQPQPSEPTQPSQPEPSFAQKMEQVADQMQTPPPPPPSGAPMSDDQKDIEENKYFTILSYIGILCLIPLFAKKDSKFAQYHAKQGVVLLAIWVAILILVVLIKSLIHWYFGYLVQQVGNLGVLAFSIIGIINVVQGKFKELPLIGRFASMVKM